MLDFCHQNWWLGKWLETPEIPTTLIKSKYTILYDGRTIFDEWSPIFENKLPWHFRNKKQRNRSLTKRSHQSKNKNARLAFLWVVVFFLHPFFCFQVVYSRRRVNKNLIITAPTGRVSVAKARSSLPRDQDPTTFLPMLEEFGDLNSASFEPRKKPGPRFVGWVI